MQNIQQKGLRTERKVVRRERERDSLLPYHEQKGSGCGKCVLLLNISKVRLKQIGRQEERVSPANEEKKRKVKRERVLDVEGYFMGNFCRLLSIQLIYTLVYISNLEIFLIKLLFLFSSWSGLCVFVRMHAKWSNLHIIIILKQKINNQEG